MHNFALDMNWLPVAIIPKCRVARPTRRRICVASPRKPNTISRQAAQTLRQLRRLATDATSEIKAGLGPEYADLDLSDLHPRRFVQKHLLDDLDGPLGDEPPNAEPLFPYGERPPYDLEAT